MKIVKNGQRLAAAVCLAAVVAGGTMPALAASPAGYTSLAQIEETNDVDPAKVQAIKDAMANIKVSYDSDDGSWDCESVYTAYEIENKTDFIMPWFFLKNNCNDLYLAMTIVSMDPDGCYYWNKVDILTGDYQKSDYTVSYQTKNVSRTYATEDKCYSEIASFLTDSSEIDTMTKILSYDTVYIRFNGQKVDGVTRNCTSLMTNENRQGITDIINLYNLMKSATPEERAAALNG